MGPKFGRLVYLSALILVMLVLFSFQLSVRRNVIHDNLWNPNKRNLLFLDTSVKSIKTRISDLKTSFLNNSLLFSEEEQPRVNKVKLTRMMRNQTLRSLCKFNKATDVRNLTISERSTLYRQIIVDDDREVIFCFTPKVACSNWKRVFKLLGGTIDPNNPNAKMDHHTGLSFLKDSDPNIARYRLLRYYKFMFVRNPLERLLSAYRNKFGEDIGDYRKRYAPKIIRKYRPREKAKEALSKGDLEITFEEFVRFLIDQDTEYMDPHWRPMHELCQPCAVNYDFIGSFENLREDAEYVLDKIRGNSTVTFPIRQWYYNPTTRDILFEYLNQVHQTFIVQLIDKYILDFVLFGYTPPKVT